jgi:ribonucleoside-diphosphate reductase alpha chain
MPKSHIQTAIDLLQDASTATLPGVLEERVKLALKALETALQAPREDRKRLPDERASITRKVEIAGHDFYINVGLYPDNHQPGEVFLKAAKEGSTLSGLMDSVGILFSLALQYGVPLKVITDKLAFSSFEPAGFTGFKGIEYAKSPIDFLARWLAWRFLPNEAKPQPTSPMASISPPDPGDGPPCSQCGRIMHRHGSNNCFICVNCATTSGSCGG